MSIFKRYHFYHKPEIERRANDLLMRMQATSNFCPEWPFDASRVADFLDIAVVWDRIPGDDEGLIAARILPLKRLIEIHEDVLEKPKGFEASTIAHEIGHWVLHINQDEADGIVEQLALPGMGIETTAQPFLCRSVSEQQIYKSSANKQLDSIEWQAQYFASCLLMPRYILEEKRVGRDLTNWRHRRAMADELGVTPSNLKHRLKDVGWIYEDKKTGLIYPGQAMSNGQTSFFVESDRPSINS